jgi:hypothetical protein
MVKLVYGIKKKPEISYEEFFHPMIGNMGYGE